MNFIKMLYNTVFGIFLVAIFSFVMLSGVIAAFAWLGIILGKTVTFNDPIAIIFFVVGTLAIIVLGYFVGQDVIKEGKL